MLKPERMELSGFRQPLASPLPTAHGEIRERRGVVVTLWDAGGQRGDGECAPLPGFGLESLDDAERALEAARAALLRSFDTLDAALDAADAACAAAPCARAALDTALHQLEASRAGLPLGAWLAKADGRQAHPEVATTALLYAREPGALRREVERGLAAGAGAVKLKWTGPGDRDRLAAVREACPSGIELRVDVNAGWREEEAARQLETLAPFTPSYVEQPVASVEGLAHLRRISSVPIAADESLGSLAGAEALAAAEAADVWVLKPAVVGGLRAARRIAGLAREAGVDVVVGGFLDGPTGRAAALALAAALPGERPAGLAPA